MGKRWYTSKTIWINAVATGIAIYEAATGEIITDPSVQVIILGVINFILRIITKEPVIW